MANIAVDAKRYAYMQLITRAVHERDDTTLAVRLVLRGSREIRRIA